MPARPPNSNAVPENRDHASLLLQQGVAALQAGRTADAVQVLMLAAAQAPDNPGILLALSGAHLSAGDPEAALTALDRLDALGATTPESCFNRGLAHGRRNDHDAAIAAFEAALARRPGFPEALRERSVALNAKADAAVQAGDWAEAANVYGRLAGEGGAGALVNRGAMLVRLGRATEALTDLDAAIRLQPDDAAAWLNRGVARIETGDVVGALRDYERAAALKPEWPEVHVHRAHAHLLSGDYAAGWELHERRFETALFRRNAWRPYGRVWDGTPAPEARLLLQSEQGYGDTIQFARFATRARARVGRLILEAPPPLCSVLASVPGVDAVVSADRHKGDFDLVCALMSLPWVLGLHEPAGFGGQPYLTAPADRVAAWRDRLGARTALRVGLVWSGRATNANDAKRSIPLARMLAALPAGPHYFALQTEIKAGDAALIGDQAPVRPVPGPIRDFADTAGLVALMDVVISVDTSVAHLAGALGRETWVLLPFVPDWRWQLQGDTTPWYRTIRLFRQREAGTWDAPLGAVGDALRARLSSSGPVRTIDL